MSTLSKLFFLLLLACWACTPPAEPTDLTKAALIPYPVSIEATADRFVLQDNTVIQLEGDDPEHLRLGTFLQEMIKTTTSWSLAIETNVKRPTKNAIYLSYGEGSIDEKRAEGYELIISESYMMIGATKAAGLYYGIQMLNQLISLDGIQTEKQSWEIPSGKIVDYPSYSYRGVMLDVSRHFFAVEDVKRFIDLISLYKINHLHLHLADDQGWRIEIKSWPLLTEIGGSTQVGGGSGGFYTQEDYRELVRYAQEHYITIVPEIDMPGHTNAALASYPTLNCNNVSPKLYTGTEVGFSTLCTSKEIVYEFVDDVVREISALTPGPYFHVGGDESHVTALEDYIPFIERVQTIVSSHGKRLIGWDEVSHAKLEKGAVVQYWADAENALRGVAQGAQVLLSPAHKVYLDMQYDSTTELGLHWAAYIEVDSAYLWSPEALVEGLDKKHILGIESPLWSETITNIDEIEYMVFPRLIGHAELSWSPASVRNWAHYSQRLQVHGQRLEAMGVDFYRSGLIDWGGVRE